MTCQTSLPEDAERIFNALTKQRFRSVLYTVVRQGGQAELSTLARRLAAAENRTSVGDESEEITTQVERRLYHIDLPKLDDAGFVDFDTDRGAVTLTENANRIDEQIAVVSELEDTTEHLAYLDRIIPETDGDESGGIER